MNICLIIGSHRSASGADSIGRAFLASILPNIPEAKMHSSITLEEARLLAEAISNHFHLNVTIVMTKASANSDETVVTELQIRDVRLLRPVIDYMYKKDMNPIQEMNHFTKAGLDIPRLHDQRAALLMLMHSKVQERFGAANLMNDSVISRAKNAGFELPHLIPLAARLFAEGYELDAIPYVFNDVEAYMDLNLFNGVLDALEGKFGEKSFYGFQAKHPWTTPDGKKFVGAEAVQRFKEICAEIEGAN